MRQIAIIAPLLFLLFFIIYFFTPDFSLKTKPESFVDEEALLLVTQTDLEKRIDEFTLSPLGRAVAAIDYREIADELDSPLIDAEKLGSIKQTVQQAIDHPLIKMLFGSEVTIALSPFKPDASSLFEQQLIDNLLIIGRPKHSAKLLDALTMFVPEKEIISESLYGGHVIKRFPLNQQQILSTVRVKDLFVVQSQRKTSAKRTRQIRQRGGWFAGATA